MTLTVSKKQRLRALEKEIREASERMQKNGFEVGRYLCEIRDECLWEEEFESWNQYLRDRAVDLVGKSFSQAARLIQAAEVKKRIPANRIDAITPSHVLEIARLAPNVGKESGGHEKDLSGLRKQDVERVLKHAEKIAGNESPSVSHVRQAVDHDLGIDRATKSRETKAKDNGIDLRDYIAARIGVVEAIREALEKIPDDAWERFNDDNPRLVKRLTTACKSLTEFLEGVE